MSKNTGTSELINYFDLGVNGDVGIAGSLDINTIANATTDTDKFLVSDTGIIKFRTGAEILADIGGQGALTNPVTGTGTIGTIPVFTSSTTIGNSIVQSNATQVNIVGNGSQLLFDSLGSAKDGGIQYVNDFTLQVYNSRGVGTAIYLGNNNLDLNVNPSINPRLRITSLGNVLINSTTDNGARLQVNGTGTLRSSLKIESTAAPAFLYFNNTAAPASNYIALGSSANEMYFQVNGADRIVIKDNGNVGIGTATPAQYSGATGSTSFQVSGTSNPSTAYPSMVLTNSGSSVAATWTIDRTSGAFIGTTTNHFFGFHTQATEKMRITSTGNVGIGTAAPSTPLDIVGTFRTRRPADTSQFIDIYSSGGEGFIDAVNSAAGTSAALVFRSGNSGGTTERMRITSGGNVLIGTATDNGSLLQVQGAIDGATFSSTAGALTINANTQFKSGFYRWNDSSTNLPEAGFFAVVIYGNCGNVVAQMATHFTNANTYVRSYNSSWTAWRRII